MNYPISAVHNLHATSIRIYRNAATSLRKIELENSMIKLWKLKYGEEIDWLLRQKQLSPNIQYNMIASRGAGGTVNQGAVDP